METTIWISFDVDVALEIMEYRQTDKDLFEREKERELVLVTRNG